MPHCRKTTPHKIAEVCLYFEYKLYRANRTTKINAEHFEAFASLNYPPLGESGVYLKINDPYLIRPGQDKKLSVQKTLNNNIVLLKLFPGISKMALEGMFSNPNLKVVLLETYGSGNAPTEKWFSDILRNAIAKGILCINITQCSGGSVIMGQYETSMHLKNMGIINGKDITTEAALAKTMYLLGKKITGKRFKEQFEVPLRGEMR